MLNQAEDYTSWEQVLQVKMHSVVLHQIIAAVSQHGGITAQPDERPRPPPQKSLATIHEEHHAHRQQTRARKCQLRSLADQEVSFLNSLTTTQPHLLSSELFPDPHIRDKLKHKDFTGWADLVEYMTNHTSFQVNSTSHQAILTLLERHNGDVLFQAWSASTDTAADEPISTAATNTAACEHSSGGSTSKDNHDESRDMDMAEADCQGDSTSTGTQPGSHSDGDQGNDSPQSSQGNTHLNTCDRSEESAPDCLICPQCHDNGPNSNDPQYKFAGKDRYLRFNRHLRRCHARASFSKDHLRRATQQGVTQCSACGSWCRAGSSAQQHAQKCLAKQREKANQSSEQNMTQDEKAKAEKEMEHAEFVSLFTEEKMAWIANILWNEAHVYTHQTITVPPGSQVQKGFGKVMRGIWWLWEQVGDLEDVTGLEMDRERLDDVCFKFFFLTIRMLMAPVRFGRQPPPDAGNDESSATKVVKHRIDRFFNGEWAALYDEANAGLVQPVHVKSEAEAAHVLAAKVEMKARHGCLQEARSSLMAKTGLLPLSDPQVREQLHELNQPPEGSPPPPIPPPPPDLHSDSSYTFELATVVRKTMKGKRIETDTLDFVMSRLKRYKAQGPAGDRYEHYKHIPEPMLRCMLS